MSLKEDIQAVKEELSTEEKFLESVIKTESFFKKNKKLIYSISAILLIAILGYTGYDYKKEMDLKKSNEDYMQLITKGENKALEEDLKAKNPKLYSLYLFQKAMKSNDIKNIEALNNNDAILKSLKEYQLSSLKKSGLMQYAGSHEILKEFAYLQAAYLELEKKNFQKANDILSFITPTSPFYQLANDLKHYNK